MFCINCGNKIPEGENTCKVCGTIIGGKQQQVPQQAQQQMEHTPMSQPQMIQPQMTQPQMINPQMSQAQMIQPQMIKPQMSQAQMIQPQQNQMQNMQANVIHPQQNMYQQPYQQMSHTASSSTFYRSRRTEFNVYSFFVGLFFLALAFLPKYNYSTKWEKGTISAKRIFEMKTEMYDRNYFIDFLDECSSSDIFAIKLYANFYIIVLFIGALLILKSFIVSRDLHKVTKYLSVAYLFYLIFIVILIFGGTLSDFLDITCYCEAHTKSISAKNPDIGFFLTAISGILFLKVKPTKEAQIIQI